MTVAPSRAELFQAPHEAVPPRRIAYEPALDGLRGVAVAAVLLYHGRVSIAGTPVAAGGYLGVDAFFVLSGYLITTLLLAEWRDRSGIALARFWGHRVRRLLPPLLVMLLLVAAFTRLAATPDVYDQLRWDGLASLFYVANWRFWASSQSYFDQFFVSPLRHTWSLAIEEQYYLVWPLVVVLALRGRGSARRLVAWCAGGALASAVLAALLFDPATDPSRVYYGTDTRVQSLLVGSGLAGLVASGLSFRTTAGRSRLALAGVLASIALAVAWVRLPATSPWLYRGGFLALAVLVAVVILCCTSSGPNPVRSVLSVTPLRLLGLISYGVYLYHWPIMVWLDGPRTGLAPGSWRLFALQVAVTLAIAVVSFVAIERPIRSGALSRARLPGWLAPVPVLLAVVVLLVTTTGARATLAFPTEIDASKRPPPATAPAGVPETRVYVVGDSVAFTMAVGFEEGVAESQDLAVWNQAVLFCELIYGARRELGEAKAPSETCRNWREDWQRGVDMFRPDVAMLSVGAWEIFDREIDGTWVPFGSPEYDAVLDRTLQDAVDVLSSSGAKVALVTVPRFERPDDGAVAKEWTAPEAWRTEHFNEVLAAVAARNPDTVELIDLAGFVCDPEACRDDVDGVELRHDGLHFHGEAGRVVAEWLAPQLAALGPNRGERPPSQGATTPGTTPPARPGAVSGPG